MYVNPGYWCIDYIPLNIKFSIYNVYSIFYSRLHYKIHMSVWRYIRRLCIHESQLHKENVYLQHLYIPYTLCICIYVLFYIFSYITYNVYRYIIS